MLKAPYKQGRIRSYRALERGAKFSPCRRRNRGASSEVSSVLRQHLAFCCQCICNKAGRWPHLGPCVTSKSPRDSCETGHWAHPPPLRGDVLPSDCFVLREPQALTLTPPSLDTSLMTPHGGHVPPAAEDQAQLGSSVSSSHTCSPCGAVSSGNQGGVGGRRSLLFHSLPWRSPLPGSQLLGACCYLPTSPVSLFFFLVGDPEER